MPEYSLTDAEIAAAVQTAYTTASVVTLRKKHRLLDATTTESMQSFLISAGTVYLRQKRDQAHHQAPSKLTKQLKEINRLAGQLSEKLEAIPAHAHDFRESRLLQQLPSGGLGPAPSAKIEQIKARYNPGTPEFWLSRALALLGDERALNTVQIVMTTAQSAHSLISTKEFSGRPTNLALNRWADNVRNFWVKGMRLPFAHSMEGKNATSAPANFCIDAMAILDTTPSKSNIMTAVRYARDAATAWEKQVNAGRANTTTG